MMIDILKIVGSGEAANGSSYELSHIKEGSKSSWVLLTGRSCQFLLTFCWIDFMVYPTSIRVKLKDCSDYGRLILGSLNFQ